ncbi:hypothetical protein ACTFIW_009730 [Dictyostelium discoideum]
MTDIEGHSHCKLFKIKCIYGDKQQIRHLKFLSGVSKARVGYVQNNLTPLFIDGAIIKRNKSIQQFSFQEINFLPKTLLGKLHGYVTDFISHSISIQSALFTNPFSVEFYANVSLQLNSGDCINADTSVGPFGRNVNSPSFIIETCISQSLPSGIEKIRKYFLSNIMVTLLLKVFGRRADGTCVSLAILHRRVGTEVRRTSHPTTHAFVINPNFLNLKYIIKSLT